MHDMVWGGGGAQGRGREYWRDKITHHASLPVHCYAARDATLSLKWYGFLTCGCSFWAAASYFGQVCSVGLSDAGTECIMGEPQVVV